MTWKVTLRKEADLHGTLDCWLNTGEGLEKTPIRVVYVTEAQVDLIAAAPELLGALKDALSGLQYIRQTHGDLYGVGWDRVEQKASAAIAKAEGNHAE